MISEHGGAEGVSVRRLQPAESSRCFDSDSWFTANLNKLKQYRDRLFRNYQRHPHSITLKATYFLVRNLYGREK